MEEDIKIDANFKKAFNLGYRLAKELNLKSPMLKDQAERVSSNPMHLGMMQFIDERKLSKNIRQNKSIDQAKSKDQKKRKGKGLGF